MPKQSWFSPVIISTMSDNMELAQLISGQCYQERKMHSKNRAAQVHEMRMVDKIYKMRNTESRQQGTFCPDKQK